MSIETLRQALLQKQLVIVAGTGVSAALSRNSPTSTWVGLLNDGIERIERASANRGALLRLRLEAFQEERQVSDLLNLATELRQEFDKMGEGHFARWLDTVVGDLEADDAQLAHAIAGLGTPILTTNYDTLLERSLSRSSATWSRPDAMRKVAKGDSDEIGHLHGIYNEPQTVIFTAADYTRVLADKAAQSVQTSAFTMKTFLFIGFGAGTDDPNFKLMIDSFGSSFASTAGAHFRLCLTGEVRPESELEPVMDLAYGNSHDDLAAFLAALKPDDAALVSAENRERSLRSLLHHVRDRSAMWRDTDSLEEKSIQDLIVAPIFLPEPHDQYAAERVLGAESERPEPINIRNSLASSKILIIAGEENAGVSTALAWALNEALLVDPTSHCQLIDDPLVAGPKPISKKRKRLYQASGVDPVPDLEMARSVLGVDNLRFESSEKFERAIADIASQTSQVTIVGVRQQDALEIAQALTEEGVSDVEIVYLGRFSSTEAQEIARRVSPGSETRLVAAVMIVIREKRLPRNPFTITLLTELIRNGSKLKEQESEIAVLDQYLDLLLIGEFSREPTRQQLTLRNKRVVLVAIARKLVETREDKAHQSDVVTWIEELFRELGWPHDAMACVDDLIRRRVLSKGPENTIRFQRSAYLELMAGIAAQEDDKFRTLVFSAPLELASIIRTYAAMSRNDASLLELMESQLDLIVVSPPVGSALARIRQLQAPASLFSDGGEASEGESQPPDRQVRKRNSYYDGAEDADRPTFLAARIEDLPPARVAMLVVDLVSRVLRDTDEIRDQAVKARLLQKLLVGWVGFLDLFEGELRLVPDIDALLRTAHPNAEPTDKDLAAFKSAVLRTIPSYITLSGISYCLSGPSLVPLLGSVDLKGFENSEYASIIRTLALYTSGSTTWVSSLVHLEPEAAKSWLSASFLASLARYAYIADKRLTDPEREAIREYLRQVIGLRYSFDGLEQRNKAMNSFENELRKAELRERMRGSQPISILGD